MRPLPADGSMRVDAGHMSLNPKLARAVTRRQDLAEHITQLFDQDQAMIAAIEKAKTDRAFRRTYKIYFARVSKEENNPNFNDPQVYGRWAQSPMAPTLVRRYVEFRRSVNERVKAIVADNGWPQRANVGDEAAAEFFFLFGHADDENRWRLTQLATLQRVAREDRVNPRMYAHLCDRLENVAGRPQIYGTVMGPGQDPGTAKLYWPIVDSRAAADARRAQIALPSIEQDLEKFRRGATIGPYMTPIEKGMVWSLADVYQSS